MDQSVTTAQPVTKHHRQTRRGEEYLTGLPWLKDCFFDLSKLSEYSSLSVNNPAGLPVRL